MWYSRQIIALRKHQLRVDLHTHAGESSDFNNENDMASAIKSLLSSAVYKGLDVIGIVSHDGPYVGEKAQQLVAKEGIDLFVLAGQEYTTSDNISMIVYHLKDKIPDNMSSEQAIAYAHKNRGFVMVITASKRQIQTMNKYKGTAYAPDAVESYDAAVGEYRDMETEYPTFICSAAKSAHDMDTINIYTIIDRSEAENIGLLPEHYGEDFIPKYLENQQAGQPQPTEQILQ